MKLRFLTVILVSAALFAGVVLWRVDRVVYGNRMEWAEAQARNQTSSLVQAINSEITSGRRMLSTVTNDSFRPELTNWKAFQPYYSLALMTSQNGAMTVTRIVNKADSPAAAWNTVQLTQYLGFLGKDLESKSAVILRAFRDPQKNHHVALIFAGGGTAYILVGNGQNFQGLIDSQKGSMSSFAIVSGDGLTISHPVPEYIGNVMSDSTLLKQIRNTGAAQGVGTFQQGRKSVFGMYEKVPGTNSYVISTVPLDDLMRGRWSLAWIVFLAAGLASLGAAIYFWYERKNNHVISDEATPAPVVVTAPVARPGGVAIATPLKAPVPAAAPVIKPAVAPAAPGHSAAVVVSNSSLVAPSAPRGPATVAAAPNPGLAIPEEPTQDKSEAYRQVAAAMGQEMRAPIASILGFSQMVLSKTQDPEVVQAVDSILREARTSRDVLEKLHTFSGERSAAKSEIKIERPITQALKTFDSVFRDKGVTVEKEFNETTSWPLATEDMIKVFENLFSNAVEAMERMQDKRLKISVSEDADGLRIQVADSGEGIAPDNLNKVFDPFFTTRSFAHHVGLGLPVVFGILKEHHAEIQIKSARGEGSQVEIHFPAEAKAALKASMRASSVKSDVPEPRVSLDRQQPPSPLAAPQASAPARPPPPVRAPTPASPLTDVNVDRLLDISSDDAPLEFLDGLGFSDASETFAKPPSSKPGAPPPPTSVATPAQSSGPLAPPPASAFELDAEGDLDAATDPLIHTSESTQADFGNERTVIADSMEGFSLEEIAAKADVEPLGERKFEPVSERKLESKGQAEFDQPEEFVAGPKPSLPSRAPAILPPEEAVAAQAAVPQPVVEAAPAPTVVIDKPKPRASNSRSALDDYKVEIRRPGKRI